MNWLKRRWKRWKEKYWDKEYFPEGRGGITPLRLCWERRQGSIKTVALWLIGLVAGALILGFLGLG